MHAQLKPNEIRNASEKLLKSLQSMGYENIDSDGVTYNVDYHMHAPDQKQHVLMNQTPFMLDESTVKKNIALA